MLPKRVEPGVVVASISTLAAHFAARCAAVARQAQADRGQFALAVPGGSVAERLLPALIDADLEWRSVELFFCDERAAPAHSPDSNFAMVERCLLAKLPNHAPHVHRMRAEDPDLVRAAQDYRVEMQESLGKPVVLDLALLGVGEDGHVASLFPNRALLTEEGDTVLVEYESPKPPPCRLTLSLDMLAGAREVVVAAFGHAKAAAVGDSLRNPESTLPLALLLQRAHSAMVLLDEDAASGLGG